MNALRTTLLALCLAAGSTTAIARDEMGHGTMEMKKSDMTMEQDAMHMDRKEDKMMKQDKKTAKKKPTDKEKKAMKKQEQEQMMKQDAMMKEDKMGHDSMQRMK
jgi:hypothetical protein